MGILKSTTENLCSQTAGGVIPASSLSPPPSHLLLSDPRLVIVFVSKPWGSRCFEWRDQSWNGWFIHAFSRFLSCRAVQQRNSDFKKFQVSKIVLRLDPGSTFPAWIPGDWTTVSLERISSAVCLQEERTLFTGPSGGHWTWSQHSLNKSHKVTIFSKSHTEAPAKVSSLALSKSFKLLFASQGNVPPLKIVQWRN